MVTEGRTSTGFFASICVFAVAAAISHAWAAPTPGTPVYQNVDPAGHSKQVLADLKALQAAARPAPSH